MKLKLFLLLLPVLTPLFICAQYTQEMVDKVLATNSEQQIMQANSEMMLDGYLYPALQTANKLLEFQPNSPNYNYRKGYIVLEMSGDYVTALPLLEKAVTNVKKNYDMFSTGEQAASIDAYYHLARAYHLDHQIDKAVEYYNKFLGASSSKSEYVFFSKLKIEQCAIAKKLLETPKKTRLEGVGTTINTDKPEYSPVVSLDGSALYFTSRRPWANGESQEGLDYRLNLYPEDIYVSYKDFDGTWTDPVRMEFCDPLQNEATLAVSSDERRIYVYEDTRGHGDIFYSDFSTNRFQQLEHLDVKGVNTDAWETHCTVTPDGQQMYFVSDRKGGFGGRDIYRIVKLPTGEWSEPVNLGPTINTAMDEESPFIAVDNKTLYFSSNGNKSMGGFDVFVSVRDENGTWSDPINLGYPLNSAGDDLFYTTTVDGGTGYLTSFRKGGKGEKDIYEVKNDYLNLDNIAVLKGRIKTVDDKPLPEGVYVTLRCTNCGDSFDRKIFPRMRDGVFLSSLEPCRQYEITFSTDTKKDFYKDAFSTDCAKKYDEIYREAMLDVDNMEVVTAPYIVMGTVKNADTKAPVEGAKVTVSYQDGPEVGSYYTAKSGAYDNIKLRKNYGDKFTLLVKIEKEGFVTKSYEIPLTLDTTRVINLDNYIKPDLTPAATGVDLGAIADLKPIYFDYNKSDIRPDAMIELNKIVKIMKDNPGIHIELGSHTDSRGTVADNQRLSERRAKSSANYIIAQGISASRITYKGYGESKLKVSDAEINAMKSDADKEAAHQKNRRTEFIVTKIK